MQNKKLRGPLQLQPIWQIKKIVEYTIDGVTYTEFLYPSGLNGYMYIASDYKKYTYTFGKEDSHFRTGQI